MPQYHAGLPMYVAPTARTATDQLWKAVHAHLHAAGMQDIPDTLDWQSTQSELCQHPHLLVGQCCGFPLLQSLHKHVTPLLSFAYDIPGCEGTSHRSAILVHKDKPWTTLGDARGSHAIINEHDSNTGMNLLRHAVAPLANSAPFFSQVSVSGAHQSSIAAIANGTTDIAAIDCISYYYARQDYPERTANLHILAHTAASPTPPLVVRHDLADELRDLLRHAFLCALADPQLQDTVRNTLRITGAKSLTLNDYTPIRHYEQDAANQGYAELA